MPLIELLLALPALIWGGFLWTWFQARSAAVKFWAFAGATILTVAPIIAYAALDESTRHVVRRLLD